MARVLVVHGVAQQYLGKWSLHGGVAAALADGVDHAGGTDVARPTDVDIAFYGNLFRKSGRRGSDEPARAADLDAEFETELLYAWWDAAAAVEPDRVFSPLGEGQRIPAPLTAQRALNALLRSRCMSGKIAEKFLLSNLRQVRRYFTEESLRASAIEAVQMHVEDDTRVLVGHSLGSVVGYEALCANPQWPVRAFVTIGSPLGMPKLIFDRLRPPPINGHGAWPGGVQSWWNVCDRHDVVSSVKQLGPLFNTDAQKVVDEVIDNGWKVHDLRHHLTADTTGRAVLIGLTE